MGSSTAGGSEPGGLCEEQYCLRWHDFQTNVTSAFSEIRDDEDLLDVTLVCPDGGMLRAHKLMLSACSPMFKAREILCAPRHRPTKTRTIA